MAPRIWNTELPGDMIGQKTTAVPLTNVSDIEWVTPIYVKGWANAQKVSLESSDIALPVEIKYAEKSVAAQSVTALAANGVYTSGTVDCGSSKRMMGHISSDQAGKLYLQVSDDGIAWYIGSELATSALSTTTISGTAYPQTTSFDFSVNTRYSRLVYVNGTTAQTRFMLTAYKVAM